MENYTYNNGKIQDIVAQQATRTRDARGTLECDGELLLHTDNSASPADGPHL
jgi:hypothetical protein